MQTCSRRGRSATLSLHTTRSKRETGFTMIEILIVVVILGLLASLVGTNVVQTGANARTKITRTQIASLATSVNAFALDCGRYPTTQEGLEALLEQPSGARGWSGPYLDSDDPPVDAWGNAFAYRGPAAGERYEILSYGSDGAPGGDDQAADISNRTTGVAAR